MRKIGALPILAFTVTTLIAAGQVQAASRGTQVVEQGGEQLDLYKAYHALDGRFVANDNGVVTDTKAGLEWFVGPDRDTTWYEAKSWAESLSVDDGGWRLPTREELKSLYKQGAGTRNMSPLLKTTGEFVWSGELIGSSYAWGFCFGIGREYWPLCSFSDTARGFAVRYPR